MGFNQNCTFGFGSTGSGGGGGVSGAFDGVSLNGANVVLGQTLGDGSNPAVLIDDREVPMDGFFIRFRGTNSFNGDAFFQIGQNSINIVGDVTGSGIAANIFMSDLISPTTEGQIRFEDGGGLILRTTAGQFFQLRNNENIIQTWDDDSLPANDDRFFQIGGDTSINFAPTSGFLTAESRALMINSSGAYNTTGGVITAYAVYAESVGTRGAGGNNLRNVALYANAAVGQQNFAAIFNQGLVLIGKTTTATTDKVQIVGNTLVESATRSVNIRPSNGDISLTADDGVFTQIFVNSTTTDQTIFGALDTAGAGANDYFGFVYNTALVSFAYHIANDGYIFNSVVTPFGHQGQGFIEMYPDDTSAASVLYSFVTAQMQKVFISFQNGDNGSGSGATIQLLNDSGNGIEINTYSSLHTTLPDISAVSMFSPNAAVVANIGSGVLAFNMSGLAESFCTGIINVAGNWILVGGDFTPTDTGEKLQVIGDSYTSGGIKGGRTVAPQTADLGLNADNDQNVVFTNEGAIGTVNLNLPTASAGKTYTFYVRENQTLQVNANTGDTIRIAGSVSAAAGNISSSTVGSSVTLVAINATEWVAVATVGSWTVT
jgi:hypothetical protein